MLYESQGYDGINTNVLELFQMNKDTLMYFIKKNNQTERNNIRLIYKEVKKSGDIDSALSTHKKLVR